MGNASSGRSLPESRVQSLQLLYGITRAEIVYLHDRFESLDFSHASEKYQNQEDQRGELATLLAEDWLFKLIMKELKVSEGMSFEKYLETYVNWKNKSIEEKLSGKFASLCRPYSICLNSIELLLNCSDFQHYK